MTFNLEITLRRYGTIIEIVGIGQSVNFDPNNFEKTLDAIIKKMLQSAPELKEDSKEFEYQKESAEAQLTEIYKEYHLEGQKSSEKNKKKIEPPQEQVVREPPLQKIENADEWHTKLLQKYNTLYDIVQKNLPNLWHSLEFELSVKAILNIKGCSLPFAGIVLGKPSSLKTVGIELFRNSRHTHYTDNFSAKSFVSHSSNVSKDDLEKIDMLPKIRNKCFLTPELAPIFATKDDELVLVLGIMTRILDGHGYESDSGVHGHRGYNERMMFTWIGAAIDIPFKVHKLLTTLGPKLYFLRVPAVQSKSDKQYYEQIMGDDFNSRIAAIGKALADYQDCFERCPLMVKDEMFGSTIPKMLWDLAKDEKQAYYHIIKLAILLAHLRGVVPTFHTKDTQGPDYGYGQPTTEEPDRAMQQLLNLAKGHALLTGRNYITVKDDIPLIVKVVLSTAPMERVPIFDLLLAYNGTLTTNQITESLNVSDHTAQRTMTEFKALGLVSMQKEPILCTDGITRDSWVISLKEKFNWFLSEEFKSLREGFKPERGREKEDSISSKNGETIEQNSGVSTVEEKSPLCPDNNNKNTQQRGKNSSTANKSEIGDNSNSNNNDPEAYWTKGKWRDYLPQPPQPEEKDTQEEPDKEGGKMS